MYDGYHHLGCVGFQVLKSWDLSSHGPLVWGPSLAVQHSPHMYGQRRSDDVQQAIAGHQLVPAGDAGVSAEKEVRIVCCAHKADKNKDNQGADEGDVLLHPAAFVEQPDLAQALVASEEVLIPVSQKVETQDRNRSIVKSAPDIHEDESEDNEWTKQHHQSLECQSTPA